MKYIIQIGAGKGKDHVWEMLKANPKEYIGLFVEPNPYIFKILKESYHFGEDYIFENIAISSFDGTIQIHFNDIDGIRSDSAHSSVNLHHVLAHGNPLQYITTLDVPCNTIKTLLTKYNLDQKEIEYLFVDTEGHDCEILLATDFTNLNIKNICFERLHTDGPFKQGEKFEKTKTHLVDHGYLYNGISSISAYDVIFTKG